MRFAVPKPLHDWRTFWSEVGIVVVGVLLALGAQQLAQEYADRQSARDAKAVLRTETAYHQLIASEIEIAAPCIRAQVEAIEQRLKAGDPAPLPRYSEPGFKDHFVVRLPDRTWASSAWDAVKSNDALRQVDPAFADQMYEYYAQLTRMLDDNRSMVELAATLNTLSVMMPRGEGNGCAISTALKRSATRVPSSPSWRASCATS